MCTLGRDLLGACGRLLPTPRRKRLLLCRVLKPSSAILLVILRSLDTHTNCIASDVLHRELEHGGVLRSDGLDREDPRAEAVRPGDRSIIEQAAEGVGVVCSNAIFCFRAGQIW